MNRAPRNYVITGASSGIGAELALQLTARGDRLALIARREEQLNEVADRALAAAQAAGAAEPFRPLCLPADVLDTEGFLARLDEADEALPGGVEVLVLNAGTGRTMRAPKLHRAWCQKIVDINLTANMHAIAHVLPRMVERQRGHIVGVSSIAGYRGLPSSAPYSASKAGFTTFLEGIRIDLKEHKIPVTTVSPGFVKSELTDLNKHPMPFLLQTDDAVRRMIKGMDKRRREVRFPWPLVLLVRLARAIPDWLYDLLARRAA